MQHLGLLSILFSWVGLLFLIWRWKGDSSMTFSQHAAKYRAARIYYAVLWLIALPCLYWFLIYPFAQKLEFGVTFRIGVTFISFAMLIAVLVPETTGWKWRVHRLASQVLFLLMIPTLVLIFLSSASVIIKAVIGFSIVGMLYGVASLVKNNFENPRMLVFQALYIALFHISILLAYYL